MDEFKDRQIKEKNKWKDRYANGQMNCLCRVFVTQIIDLITFIK